MYQAFVNLDMYPLNRPEVMIPYAQDKFDSQGNLVDEKTKERIRELVVALAAWATRLKKVQVAQA